VKREVVAAMVARGVAERRACRAGGMPRATDRYQAVRPPERQAADQQLREKIVALAHKHRRFGYRRVTALLRREGERVNHKRVWRIWQAQQLSVPRRTAKKWVKNLLERPASWPTQAFHRGHVWSYDFIFDWTEQGQQLKMLGVLDEYTRECHTIKVGLKLDSKDVKDLLAELCAAHGAPEYRRSDNGGEFIAAELHKWLEQRGTKTVQMAPGHPWENGYVESCNGRFRDECLNQEVLWNERQAQVVVEDWRKWYEEERPHSALGYCTPKEVAATASTHISTGPN
jgi:transposase InsO family protein